MEIVGITLAVFLIAFLGMAIGVIVAGKRIQGSCGGIGALLGASACDMCSNKTKCKNSKREICEEGEQDCEADC